MFPAPLQSSKLQHTSSTGSPSYLEHPRATKVSNPPGPQIIPLLTFRCRLLHYRMVLHSFLMLFVASIGQYPSESIKMIKNPWSNIAVGWDPMWILLGLVLPIFPTFWVLWAVTFHLVEVSLKRQAKACMRYLMDIFGSLLVFILFFPSIGFHSMCCL